MSAQTFRERAALARIRPVARNPAPWWIWPLLIACVAVVVGAEFLGSL